jgi:hypothetical protein
VVGVREQDRDRLLADLASALTTASTDLDRVVQCAARAGSELIGEGAAVRLVRNHLAETAMQAIAGPLAASAGTRFRRRHDAPLIAHGACLGELGSSVARKAIEATLSAVVGDSHGDARLDELAGGWPSIGGI